MHIWISAVQVALNDNHLECQVRFFICYKKQFSISLHKEGIGDYLMQVIQEHTTYLLTYHGGKQQTRFTSVSTQNACQLQSHQKPNLFIHWRWWFWAQLELGHK